MANKKYDFVWVQSLTDYTNENTGLMARAVYGASTIKGGIEIIVGQKGSVKLNTLTNEIYLQAAACGWTVSGTTSLGQVSVTVCSLDYKEALCPKTLEPKWYGQLMAKGSNPETFPFAEYIMENKIKALSAQLEYMYWQGDSTFGSGNLETCDGIGAFLSGTTNGTTYVAASYLSGTSHTAANIVASVNAMAAAIDERVADREDLTLYMCIADYKTYIQALVTANLYHYNPVDGNPPEFEYYIPGTNIQVKGTPGLRGTHFWYLTPKSNLVFVTDLLDETEDLDMWYSKDNIEIRINGSLKFGAGAYFNAFIVHNNPNLGVIT